MSPQFAEGTVATLMSRRLPRQAAKSPPLASGQAAPEAHVRPEANDAGTSICVGSRSFVGAMQPAALARKSATHARDFLAWTVSRRNRSSAHIARMPVLLGSKE